MTPRQICTFALGDLLLAVDVDRVLGVVRTGAATPVPLAPKGVAGLLNLRGRIITAVDARQRVGLPPLDGTSVSVVIRSDGEAMSLLVDRAGEVLEVDETMSTHLPTSCNPVLRSLTTSAYLVDGDTVLVLDPDKTLSVAST